MICARRRSGGGGAGAGAQLVPTHSSFDMFLGGLGAIEGQFVLYIQEKTMVL